MVTTNGEMTKSQDPSQSDDQELCQCKLHAVEAREEDCGHNPDRWSSDFESRDRKRKHHAGHVRRKAQFSLAAVYERGERSERGTRTEGDSLCGKHGSCEP